MSLITALVLAALLCFQELPTGAVDRHEALRQIKGTPANEFDDRLPHVPVDKWLRAAVPKRWTVGWSIGDCDEQWVPPEPAEGYRVCATAFLTAPAKESKGAHILFLVGTRNQGVYSRASVYQIVAAKDLKPTLVDRLGDLIDWLKTEP